MVELVLDAKAILGEGPSWDAEKKVLYWVDILEGKIHRFDPAKGIDDEYVIGQYVGAVVPDTQGRMVLAAQHGFYRFHPETSELKALDDPEAGLPGNRFNDGKCDIKGRFWAGTMSMSDEPGVGALYCLDTNKRVERIVSGVTTSNGITWSPDHTSMYYIDSPTKRVVQYDFDPDSGRISGGRTVVVIPEGEGFPDGMTTDNEGMLWVAQWDGWCVSRWNPATGERLAKVDVPAARVTSCVFGGDGLDELYITSARTGISDAELQRQPLAGGVFRYKPGVAGMASYPFEG